MSRLHPRASAPTTPLPPSNDASPAAPSPSPRAFVFGARKLQYVFETVQTRTKHARCVQRAGRVRDAHHVPPTSTATFSSTPRAGPSQSCDPSPRHAQGPTSIRFFSDYFLHTPARNARPAPPRAFSTVTRHPSAQFCACATPPPIAGILHRRLFHLASAALDGNPKG
jgi:hypothetical protein